ncbi:stage II sporulation protein M [Chengkuizengella marina]|nr:stage II sporulation protein M [Chengkuizengella marina]
MNDENNKINEEEKLNKVTILNHDKDSNSETGSTFLKDVFNFRNLFIDFNNMKLYFFISTMLFVIGVVIGFNANALEQLLQPSLQKIGEIGEKIERSDNSQLTGFIYIFKNNVQASLVMVYSGAFFSLLPIASLLMNGMLIGYVFKLVPQSGSDFSMMELFLRGILPHGIFEIPAILIASAYGIKLGVLIMKWLVQSGEKDLRSKNKSALISFMKLSVTLVIFTVATLMLAAIIESTITPILLG